MAALPAPSKSDLYRSLPSVDELLRNPDLADATARKGRAPVTDAARVVLERVRRKIASENLSHADVEIEVSSLVSAVIQQLTADLSYSLRPVINATGVILHTNLGRAPLAHDAIDHLQETASGYSNLEFDLESGERGERDVHVDRLFRKLFQESASERRELATIVVNNNAAAVWLALNTLAAGGEVIVSRGELVEIGGSFRIPDVMAQSNGILKEVGTTNRTRINDYEKAINEKTRALLRVHRSNFEITGFTEQAGLEELVELARSRQIPLIEDLGSGALIDLRPLGAPGESAVIESLRAGVDVVTYSGDKLLGGPQAGMLTGRADLIRRMRANSLFRALRVGKLAYATLEATLLAYVKRDLDAIPAIRMMHFSPAEIGERAEAMAGQLRGLLNLQLQVIEGESVIGGGAAPSATLPTRLLAARCTGMTADQLQAQLRNASTPVITRVQDDRVLIDLRTVFQEQDAVVVKIFGEIAEQRADAV